MLNATLGRLPRRVVNGNQIPNSLFSYFIVTAVVRDNVARLVAALAYACEESLDDSGDVEAEALPKSPFLMALVSLPAGPGLRFRN